MLLINTDMWKEHVIKLNSSNKWSEKESAIITKCVLKQIKDMLIEVNQDNLKMVLIVDLTSGDFPPFIDAIKIAKFFVSVQPLLVKSLEYTIVYATSDTHKKWLNRILKLYTPARPIHIVSSKKDIKQKIYDHITKNKNKSVACAS